MSKDFIAMLGAYRKRYPDEAASVENFLQLLRRPDCFHRTCRPGHFTASALVLNPERNRVLLLLHRKLGIWLQPGGHADSETDLLKVARKEVAEETGLDVSKSDSDILDLDIHPISARKDDDAHLHYDVRFLFTSDPNLPLTRNSESTDIRWVAAMNLEKHTREESLLRMLRKAGWN